MFPIGNIPPGGNIPPANRARRGKGSIAASNLTEISKRLAQLQPQVVETEAWSGETTPKITHGVSFGGLGSLRPGDVDKTPKKVWRSYPAKTVPRQELKPPPEPYAVNSWEAVEYFAVLIEGVKTPNWQDHSHGISVSVHGDILRIVDTRKGASQGAVTEILIPKEYGHDLHQAVLCGNGYEKWKGVELRFPKKDGAE